MEPTRVAIRLQPRNSRMAPSSAQHTSDTRCWPFWKGVVFNEVKMIQTTKQKDFINWLTQNHREITNFFLSSRRQLMRLWAAWTNNYKDTKAKCRHLKKFTCEGLCLSEFIGWSYSQSCWYILPSFVNCFPSPLFSGLTPSPLPCVITVCKGGGGKGYGVLGFR